MAAPCLQSETLLVIPGCRLHLKLENLQFTASFKERGVLSRLLMLNETERAAGVCAMSAGNHAQGVATHARRLCIPATIFMPEGTPLTKISRTREHGATVIVAGASLADAQDTAVDRAGAKGLVFIHPYDDPAVIAGRGHWRSNCSPPAGPRPACRSHRGGGLLAGLAIAARELNPHDRWRKLKREATTPPIP